MRQKILKQVGVLLTVSILLTFLVVSLTMYSCRMCRKMQKYTAAF